MLRFLKDADLRASVQEHRGRLAGASFAVIARALLALAGPHFLGRAMDVVAERRPAGELWTMVGLLVAFAIGTGFAQFWMRWLWIGWSRFTERRMRQGLFDHLLGLSPPFHDRSRVGDLMSRLTADVEAVRMGYGPGIMHFCQTGLILVAGVSLMLWRSTELTLWALLPLVLLFIGLSRLLPRIHARSLAVQEAQSALSTRAQESFSGARVIKAFGREPHESDRFSALSGDYREASLGLARSRGLFSAAVELANALVTMVVLLVGGGLVIAGELTVGVFAEFQGYLTLMIWPMIALSWTFALFQRADAAAGRIAEVRGSEPSIVGGERRDAGADPSLEVRELSARLPARKAAAPKSEGEDSPQSSSESQGRLVLDGLSFRVQPGGTLGVVGPTGSGKSQLVQRILRLEDPPPHTVFLGGHDVRELSLKALRSQIAYVPQESFLFGDTLEANLRFAAEDASAASLEEAIHRSCLDRDLDHFADGLDTVVGERGVSLSGGQRQRVAIARALLRASPILLLDDALSAVDVETEQEILRRLAPVLKDRTALIVSHRLSAVANADEIIVLDEGRIVERGTHEELLKLGRAYARTHALQQDERELEALQ